MKVRKEKYIYHTLNMLSLDVTKKCLVAEGWSPVFATKQVLFLFPASSRCSKQALPLVFSCNGTSEMYYLNSYSLDFINADPGCVTACSNRLQLASWSYFSGFAYKRVTTYIFSHKQIHFCFSGNC